MSYIFTSEHVTPGHPDKVMDAIAESIVDYQINRNPNARVAVDGAIKNEKVFLCGEVTGYKDIPFTELVKNTLKHIGYTDKDYPNLQVMTEFTDQSENIARGVNKLAFTGAGDIGIMFGGAVKESPELTCWSHFLARQLCFGIHNAFTQSKPDGKCQVSVEYEGSVPKRVVDVVLCFSYDKEASYDEFTSLVNAKAVEILSKFDIDFKEARILVNPTGAFYNYGSFADSGLVGRKIVCDQYGGYFPVGGGALSGKDPSKVDRSAVYMARAISRSIIEKGWADKVQVQYAYAIGVPDPVSVNVLTFGTEHTDLRKIEDFVRSVPADVDSILKLLKLTEPSTSRGWSYEHLGMYGHIGKNPEGIPTWESILI